MDVESGSLIRQETDTGIKTVSYADMETWDLIRHLSMYRLDLWYERRWSKDDKAQLQALLMVAEHRLGQSISGGTKPSTTPT